MKVNFMFKYLFAALLLVCTLSANGQLSGSYTVDPASSAAKNYTSVKGALTALSTQGVTAPVTFLVEDGTYTGLHKVDSIPGASEQNTITFIGDSLDSSKVVLRSTQDAVTLHLNGAKHLRFRYFTIENSYSSTYYNLFINHGDSNSFESCNFKSNTNGLFGYNAYLNDAEYNSFRNCHFEGGYNNVYLFGAGVNIKSYGNYFEGCVLEKQYYNGFSQYYCSHTSFVKSSIDSFVNGRNGYAFDAYSSNAITLQQSKIWGSGTTLYLSFCNFYSSLSTDTNRITSNMLGGGYYATVYSYQSNRCNFLNNSIEHSDGDAASKGVNIYHAQGHRWLNNNIKSLAGGYGLYLYGPTGYTPKVFDYNNLYLSGTSEWAYFLTQNVSSLSKLKTQYKDYNQMSISIKPGFLSERNLGSLEPELNGAGKYVGIKEDINGLARPHGNDNQFDIGCSEFWLPSQDLDITAVINPVRINVNNTVTVSLRNRGEDDIVDGIYTISYSVDSGKQYSVTEVDTIHQLAPGDFKSYSFKTAWKPQRTGDFRLVVKIDEKINGDPDNTDSIFVDICSGLSGTYTINPAKPTGIDNFNSLKEAVNKLSCGLDGPTVFLLSPGTYNDAIEISKIAGASAGAHLTIDGQHADSVRISHQGRSFEKAYTIQLNNASYVDLKNLTIISKSDAFGQTVRLCNGASYNLIENCKIIGENSSSSNSAGIALQSNLSPDAGTAGTGNRFFENTLNGHYYGIQILGRSGMSSQTRFNQIKDNTVSSYYQAGISMSYTDSSVVESNALLKPRYSSGFGYYEYNCRATQLLSNEVIDYGKYGIYTHYSNHGFPYSESVMLNNMVAGTAKLTSNFEASAGVNIYSNSRNWIVWHNSVQFKSSNTPGYYSTVEAIPAAIRFVGAIDLDVRNNIFSNHSQSSKSVGFLNSYSTFASLDYNQYYSATNKIIAHDGFNIKNLSTWQTVRPGWNDNSLELKPHFVSAKNLRLLKSKTSPRGAHLGVSYDIDGASRCGIAPSLGAAESTHPTSKPKAFFAANDTLYSGTPYKIYNGSSPYAKEVHEWWVAGKKVIGVHHLKHTFTGKGYTTIALVSSNCGGTDTFRKTVYIDSARSKPVADFASDKDLVSIEEEVQLTDLSTNGPDTFNWRLSPYWYYDVTVGFNVRTYDFVNGTDSNSRYPEVAFFYPGEYDVCLRVQNRVGNSAICKDKYITVKDLHVMCSTGASSGELQGNLFDPGGASGNYGSGTYYSCSFLIDPCASELNLSFNHFDLAAGDFLRIYDGVNSQAPALHYYNSFYANGLTGNLLASYFNDTLVASSGKAYIEFQTSNYQGATGFDLTWEGKQGSGLPPNAAFSIPDSVCRKMPFTAINQSSGRNNNFYWSMKGEDVDYTDSIVRHSYDVAGTYWVKLEVENCYGYDADSQKIEVVKPTKAPKTDFSTPNLKVKKGHPVQFFNDSKYRGFDCSNSWIWRFSTDLIDFVQGTDSTSENPIVAFQDTGCFDVMLIAGNTAGKDSMIKNCYIEVIEYCAPSVAFLNSDLGISRVVLNEIDHSSSMGISGYTDYSQDHSTTLQIGDTYKLEIHRSGNLTNSQNGAVWIDYNQDGDFDDSTELVASSAPAKAALVKHQITVPNGAKLGLTTMRVAVNISTRKNIECGPNQFGEFEDYGILISPDREAPELFIDYLGKSYSADTTINIEQCASWSNPTGYGMDNVDGRVSLAPVTGKVNLKKPGKYELKYSATDAAMNEGVSYLTVNVLRDTTSPILQLKGKVVDTLEVFSNYTDSGAIVVDNCDTGLTYSVLGSVDMSSLGTYTMSYTVSDKSFNVASASRVVMVLDRTAPTLSFISADTTLLGVFERFKGLDLTLADNYYSPESLQIEVTGKVDTSVTGTYLLTYQVIDGSGNSSALIKKWVTVVDTIFPQLRLKGPDTVEVDVHDIYIDAGIVMSDNYTSRTNLDLQYSGSFVDSFGTDGRADKLGVFELYYEVSDESGNSSIIKRWIEVVDREAPVAEVKGSPVVEIERWAEYVDEGVLLRDNYWSDDGIKVTTTTNVNTQVLGVYHVTYCPRDSSGNIGSCVYRVVHVVEPVSVLEHHNMVIKAFPIPANDYVILKAQNIELYQVQLRLMNGLGQVVYTTNQDVFSEGNELLLPTKNLQSGVYYATLEGPEQSYIVKLVIEH